MESPDSNFPRLQEQHPVYFGLTLYHIPGLLESQLPCLTGIRFLLLSPLARFNALPPQLSHHFFLTPGVAFFRSEEKGGLS